MNFEIFRIQSIFSIKIQLLYAKKKIQNPNIIFNKYLNTTLRTFLQYERIFYSSWYRKVSLAWLVFQSLFIKLEAVIICVREKEETREHKESLLERNKDQKYALAPSVLAVQGQTDIRRDCYLLVKSFLKGQGSCASFIMSFCVFFLHNPISNTSLLLDYFPD